MKGFSIYQRHGNVKPFMMHTFTDVLSAKLKLNDITATEEERGRPYFVDNDFFNNKFSHCSNLYYLCIMEREVGECSKFCEKQSQIKEE